MNDRGVATVHPLALLLTLLSFVADPAGATRVVLDFEDIGGDPCVFFVSAGTETRDFRLEDPIPGSNLFTCNGSDDSRSLFTNGTRSLVTRNVEITRPDGRLFDLVSLELGEFESSFFEAFPVFIVLEGRGEAGQVTRAIRGLDLRGDGVGGIEDFERFSFESRFTGLTSLRIFELDQTNFFVDNVELEVVPEPGSAVLLLMGLACCSATRLGGRGWREAACDRLTPGR